MNLWGLGSLTNNAILFRLWEYPGWPTLRHSHVWTPAAKLLQFFCQTRRSVAFCGATIHNNQACIKIPHFLDAVNPIRTWNSSHSSPTHYFSHNKLIGNSFFFLFPWNSERHIVVTKKLVIILKTENSGCGISGKNNNNSSVNIKFNILLPGFESLQIYWVYLCIFFFHPILPCIPYLTNLVSCIFFSREHSSI